MCLYQQGGGGSSSRRGGAEADAIYQSGGVGSTVGCSHANALALVAIKSIPE